jgi:hypothetical protein
MTTTNDRIAKLKPPLPRQCDWCEQDDSRFQGVGPVRTHIDPILDLEVVGERVSNFSFAAEDRSFCSWECAADWFAEQTGRTPHAPRGSCAYRGPTTRRRRR